MALIGNQLVLEMKLILLLFVTFWHQALSCMFPEYLQSNQNRQWQGHITRPTLDTSKSYTLLIGFNGQAMKCQVTGGQQLIGRPRSFVRECLDEVKPGRYLVAHRETDTGSRKERFSCMQFLWRSDHVIEIREARLVDVMNDNLCEDENLILNEWPLLNRRVLSRHKEKPPLLGGYSIMLFDKSTQTELCPTFENQLRLESECVEGEGLVFNFRERNCIPKGIRMRPRQTVYCFGYWTEEHFQFMILRHPRLDYQWCFRIPKETESSFVGYLFKDVHCSRQTSGTIQRTQEYIRIHMRKDPPRSLDSLCYDEYENCPYRDGICADKSSKNILMCAKTCGLCNENIPSMCTLPEKIRGSWHDSTRNGQEIIQVKEKELSVLGYKNYQCVNWTRQNHEEVDAFSQMFVAAGSNGCKPRYACAEFHLKTPALLRYRLSHNLVWPFPGADPYSVNCEPFERWYKDDKPPLKDRFHSKHQKVLVSGTSYKVSPCKLHHDRVFNVSFPDGKQCMGAIEEVGYPVKTHLYVLLNETCSNLPPEKEYECVDSTQHGYYGDLMIIARKISNRTDMSCWMFPLRTPLVFYLLKVSDCYAGAVDKIKAGTVKPIAMFNEIPQPVEETTSVSPLYKNTTLAIRTGMGGNPNGGGKSNGGGKANGGGGGYKTGGSLPGNPDTAGGTSSSQTVHVVSNIIPVVVLFVSVSLLRRLAI